MLPESGSYLNDVPSSRYCRFRGRLPLSKKTIRCPSQATMMDTLASQVRSTAASTKWFVEAFLGLSFLLSGVASVVSEVTGQPSPAPYFGAAVIGIATLATYPFVTGTLSTEWIGNYLLGFLGVLLVLIAAGLGALVIDVAFVGTVPSLAFFAAANLAGVAAAVLADEPLRR